MVKVMVMIMAMVMVIMMMIMMIIMIMTMIMITSGTPSVILFGILERQRLWACHDHDHDHDHCHDTDQNYFQHPKCYVEWLAVPSIVSALQ